MEGGQLVREETQRQSVEVLRAYFYDYSYIYRAGLAVALSLQQQADSTLITTEWGQIAPIYRADLLPREEDAWELTGALLNRLQAESAAIGAELVVVYLPEAFQVVDALWQKVEQSSEIIDRNAPNDQLATLVPDGAHLLNLLPDFRSASEALYYENDEHFNPTGHALAADLLYGYLLEYNLLAKQVCCE